MTDHTADREMQRLADALSAEWDAINRGGKHVSPGAAEPLIGAARRLHAVDTTPALSRQRRDRIWRGIMAAHATASPSPPPIMAFPASRTSRALDERASTGGAQTDRISPARSLGRWVSTQLATAAILVLTLAVGYVAFSRAHVNRGDEPLPGIPVLVASPATMVPEANESQMVVQATIDALPPLTSWAGIERTTLDPGASWTRGRSQELGEGPIMYVVESGTLTIRADGPTTMTRAGSNAPATVDPGTEVTLQPGDRGYAPTGVISLWRNNGADPAIILDAAITTPSTSLGWSSSSQNGVNSGSLVEEAQFTAPQTPITMTLSRVTLEPGETLAADALPNIEMLWVASGTMTATDTTSSGTAPPFAFDKGSTLQRSFPPGRIFRSADDQPVTLLVMTITPAETATPAPP